MTLLLRMRTLTLSKSSGLKKSQFMYFQKGDQTVIKVVIFNE